MIRILIVFIIQAGLILRLEALPEDPDEYQSWESGMLTYVSRLAEENDDEALEKLSDVVYRLEFTIHREKGSRPVFRAARNAIMAVPQYGDFFLNTIESERRKLKSGEITSAGSYDGMRIKVTSILANLPSPESVRVLGGLIDDTESRQVIEADEGISSSNSQLARRALIELLDDPPSAEGGDYPLYRDFTTWQLWFEQVKAGTRTFRFKGDPQPYTLAGPAEKELRPALAGAAHDLRPREGSPQGQSAPLVTREHGESSPGIPWPAIMAALLLLITGLFAAIHSSRTRGR